MKKLWITLLSVLTLALSICGIVACGGPKDVLSNYTLKEAGTLVEKDFVLPYDIGGKKVTWTSDKDAITVEKRTEDWLAKVTLGDEATTVTLTVACGKESKDFEVTVAALDVSYFVKNFKFKQKDATVFENFDLLTETTINGKTATITWSVDDEEDSDYIEIIENGTKCKVTQSTVDRPVTIYAEFDYNGHKQKTNYRMTVSFERTHQEEVNYWYYNTGVSITMSGYVVAIGTAYSADYENVTLYMVDDDFCAGYYLYRVKATPENGALLKPGVHVTVTGTTNTNYNGLVETNAGGELVVDKDNNGKVIEIAEADKAKLVYAIDDDILAKSPAALYNTSRLVSLDKWKVVDKAQEPAAGASATLFTLEKNGVKVSVGVSKYMEGVYKPNKDDATYKGIVDLYNTINKDDVVSVEGILGNYNGYQILPLKAADIKKETVAATEASDACKNVLEAIAAVNNQFKANGVGCAGYAGYIIVADKEIELPATEGVEIKCELVHPSSTVTLEGNKIILTAGVEDNASIKVTYTVKDAGEDEEVVYETCTYHTLHSKKMSGEEVLAKAKFDLELAKKELTTNISLPVAIDQYPGVTITWALKEPVEGVSVSTDNKTLNVKPSTTEAKNAVLVATISYSGEGEAPAPVTKEIKIKILKVDPVATGTFVMFMDVKSEINKKLYFTGEFDGSYGATSESPYDAAQVVIEEASGGYTFKVDGKYLELDSSHLLKLNDAQNGVWEYDYTLKVFTWDVTGYGVCVIGTYTNTSNKTYTTISASKVSHISGDKASTIGKTQFPVGFEKPTEDKRTDAEKVTAALAKVQATLTVKEAGDTTLPVSKVSGVAFAWKVKEGTAATVADGKLNVATLPAEDATVTLTLTASCGEATVDKEVTVTIKAAEKDSFVDPVVPGTYKLALKQNNLDKKLYFTGAMNGYYYGTTENVSEAADVVVTAQGGDGFTLKVGDKYMEIVVSGSFINVKLVEESTGVWVYNSELKVLTWTASNEKTYYLGTSATYNTISANEISKISGDNAGAVGVSQFVAQFEAIGA